MQGFFYADGNPFYFVQWPISKVAEHFIRLIFVSFIFLKKSARKFAVRSIKNYGK